jgi:signal transduction histidine kinase
MLAAAPMKMARGSASDRAVLLARIGSLLAFGMGLLVIAGWYYERPPLTYIFVPFGPNVKTNAGVALAAAGLGNYCLLYGDSVRVLRWLGRILAFVCLAIGALTFLEHTTGWDLRIDELLAFEPAGVIARASPNRMGPPASIAFLLIGLSLVLIDSRTERLRAAGHGVALLSCLTALLPLVGYAYGLTALYALARFTGIALSTAMALLVVSLAIVAGRPDLGLARLICRDDESGMMSRQLLAAAVLLTFGVGWFVSSAYHLQLVDGAFAISAMTIVLIMGFSALIWRTGTALSRALDQRAAIASALEESAASLREADRQKTAFLATLSHELRNPLAPIRFALHSLDGPPEHAERAKQVIGRQVNHLVRLVDDLLDVTRITHNKVQLQLRAVEVQQVLRDAADAVSYEVSRHRHVLAVEPPAMPLWVKADADRLVQILVNLLTNAARYTPASGRIELGAAADGDEVVFRVRDTGAGLEPADLARVFDMFVQIGEGRHGGLGIGLALVKGLVGLHGGTVEADSEGRGRGAEFRVRLQRTLPALAPGEALPAGTAMAPRSILVVDDNTDAAETLREVLATRGHDVRVAHDGTGALEMVLDAPPEVALLDLGLPDIDGLTLARRLRDEPRTAGMLLIAITGFGQDEDRRRALGAGFDAHVTKPADLNELLALIDAPLRLTPPVPASG